VTEGKFLEWKIEEGEEVEEDQIVGSAETDKAVVEIPSPSNGKVQELKASPGDTVKVGDTIMILETGKNEDRPESKEEKDAEGQESEEERTQKVDAVMGGAPSASSYSDEDRKEKQEADENDNEVLALPKVRKKAEEMGVDLSTIDKDGRITEEDLEKASKSPEKAVTEEVEKSVSARPSVKRLAREKGVNLSKVEGSGRDGEVTREDVEKYLENSSEKDENSSQSSEEPEVHIEDEGLVEKVEMNSVRKATARKMKESKFSAPHVTHVEKADITELVELRESVRSKVDAHLTYLPFIMKALVAGLKEHPDLNSELDGENETVIRKKFYDFNIAVDTDRGLLVPKIEDVDGKNMIELAEAIGKKAEKAQHAELSAKEMEPGTFSITNLGVIGGEEFTPIIYPPQTAILGVGKISETAEVVDGELVPRKTVKLSLSYDHRVVDGAAAARFMNKVVEDLENPRELILEL